jgi:hypothetical protein
VSAVPDKEAAVTSAPPAGAEERTDYTGAVYGSLLAASVIVGTTPGEDPQRPLELIALLLATGIVFWLAHVYAEMVGGSAHPSAVGRVAHVRAIARHEWPLVEAAIPPAAAVALGSIWLSDAGAAWLALGAAVAGQVGWAVVAARQAGVPPRMVVLSGVGNFALGMIIVLLKAGLGH